MVGNLKKIIVLLLCVSFGVYSQQKKSRQIGNEIEVGINFYYYHPNLDEFNKNFSKLENNLLLPRWNDFKINYLVVPKLAYAIDSKQRIALDLGWSYWRYKRENIKSYYYLWMGGVDYRYKLIARTRPTSGLHVSLGGGLISAMFSRSYGNNVGIYTYGRKFYIKGGSTFSVEATDNIELDLNLGYIFVPKMTFDKLKNELSLKSFSGGVGIRYTL